MNEGLRCSAEGLQWSVHPLAQEPRLKSTALCLALMAVPVAAALSFGGLLYGVISLVVLVAAMSRYLFPTHYRLDAAGMESDHLWWKKNRRWTDFGRARIRPDGLFLSPFRRPSRLDSFRGEFLRCVGNQQSVSSFVERHVGG
jgi:hypothetical protein